MAKRKITGLLLTAVFICMLFLATHTFLGSIQAAEIKGYKTGNVAIGKDVRLKNYLGEVISFSSLHGDAVDISMIVNGINNPHNGVIILGDSTTQGQKGWIVIDLGEVYTLTEIKTAFWNDHSYSNVVIQGALSEDFSEGKITFYNNDAANLVGEGVGSDGAYIDKMDKYQSFGFYPSAARYIRVTNVNTQWGCTAVTDIQVIGVTEGVGPVQTNKPFENISQGEFVVLSTAYAGAEIFYTTDGNYPGSNSTKYSAPIDITALGNKVLLRAVVKTAEGFLSEVTDFYYQTTPNNLARGKTASFKKHDGSEGVTSIFTGQGTIESITDGNLDPFNVYGTPINEYCWAIIDLGDVYQVDKVMIKLYHDWYFLDVVVQLALTEDFTQGKYTVANYDYDNSVGEGIGETPADAVTDTGKYYLEKPDTGHEYAMEQAVSARYIRVYSMSAQDENKRSMWEEIQVYEALGQYPQKTQMIKSITDVADFEIVNGYSKTQVLQSGKLPQSILVKDYDGAVYALSGSWDSTDFDGNAVGVYTFKFTATDMPATLLDADNVLNIKVTVLAPTDKTLLKNKIDDIKALDLNKYTLNSRQDLTEAVTSAEATYLDALISQGEIDTALQNLIVVANALVEKGDDASLLLLISEVEQLTASDYTISTYVQLTTSLADAKQLIESENAIESQITLMYAELDGNFKALALRGDKTALSELYNLVKDTVNIYTTPTWSAFEDALENADAVLKKDGAETTKAEADIAHQELQLKHNELVVKADFSQLSTLLTAEQDRDTNTLTPLSKSLYLQELQLAQSVLADDTNTQQEIAAAVQRLNGIIEGLKIKADKTALNVEINKALNQSQYTAGSVAIFLEQLAASKIIAENPEAVQSEVDESLSLLIKAKNAFVQKADKSELLQAIAVAEAFDAEGYTAVSEENFNKALQHAKNVADSNDASQADADSAEQLLLTALKQMEKQGSIVVTIIVIAGAIILLASVVLLILKKKELMFFKKV